MLSVSNASWNTPAAVRLCLTRNNELLVNIIHRAVMIKLTNACVAILTGKKKNSDLRKKMKPTSLRGSFIHGMKSCVQLFCCWLRFSVGPAEGARVSSQLR